MQNAKPNVGAGTEPTTRDRGKQGAFTVPSVPHTRTQAQVPGADPSVVKAPSTPVEEVRSIPASRGRRVV